MLVEALTLGLLLLAAVLASSLIDQIIPRVSLPLIQIAIGLLIAVVAGGDVEVTLDPELFLVMFIAPLLYDEAKHADKQALWRERKPVLSLAIGLVVATTLVIGFLLRLVNGIFNNIIYDLINMQDRHTNEHKETQTQLHPLENTTQNHNTTLKTKQHKHKNRIKNNFRNNYFPLPIKNIVFND